MEPLISIITASYNYENYIKETIESVLNQTYQNWEMIIVDDGSKDNSVDIIKEYCEKDKRIKLYTHENKANKGLVETIKLALSKANGKYIAFVESDDYIRNDYLEKKLNVFNQNPDVKFICNNIEPVGNIECAPHKYLKTIEKFWSNKKTAYDIKNIIYLFNPVPTFSCVMFEKDLIEDCNFNPPKKAWLDLWLWAQMTKKTKFININDKLTYWRFHKVSYIKREEADKTYVKTTIEFYKQLYDMVDKNMPFKYKLKISTKHFLRMLKYNCKNIL